LENMFKSKINKSKLFIQCCKSILDIESLLKFFEL